MAVKSNRTVTCTSPVNIAVIKYWGKRDQNLILPINSSLSGTLNQSALKTTTSAMLSKDFTQDRIWLNGIEQDIQNKRIQNVVSEIKAKAISQGTISEDDLNQSHFHICSENNFPTAAGLASSASGYACLVQTLSNLYGISDDQSNLSRIARIGSGSACRSMFGGFVKWNAGVDASGSDSVAVQVADEEHWPEMEVLVCVVSDSKKTTSSTSGMQTTVDTSDLIEHRAEVIVPKRMQEIEKAILEKDFETFGKITMQDSNQFHACCMDTYPPIFYMNDTSKFIVRLITEFNILEGGIKAAYTFDAGPNAVIYAQKKDMGKLVAIINLLFSNGNDFYQGMDDSCPEVDSYPTELVNRLFRDGKPGDDLKGSLKYLIHTNLGPGPKVVEGEDECLLDDDGMPKRTV